MRAHLIITPTYSTDRRPDGGEQWQRGTHELSHGPMGGRGRQGHQRHGANCRLRVAKMTVQLAERATATATSTAAAAFVFNENHCGALFARPPDRRRCRRPAQQTE